MVAAAWGAFWAFDEVIAKWGSVSIKGTWDKYTLHFPFDWKIGLIGLLSIMVVLLIEGSFRHAGESADAHSKELLAVRSSLAKEPDSPRDDPWLQALNERKKLEAELQSLLEIEESGAKLIPQIKIGKDEGDYRREKIDRLKRDIRDISERLAPATGRVPDITGEILFAKRPMMISPYKGHAQSMLLLKVRITTKTDVPATIRRANLTVESNSCKYESKKQPIEIEPVTFHHQFSQPREETPFDLIDRVAKEPLRHAVGTEGWLQFLVDGLPTAVGIADLYLTITDDLGGEHLISARSFSID